jgi:hypothetical protein
MQYRVFPMLMTLIKDGQFLFRKRKQVVEYKQKQTPVAERQVRMIAGIPKYSVEFLETIKSRNAVRKAPIASTRKMLLGLSANRCINLFIAFSPEVWNAVPVVNVTQVFNSVLPFTST